MMITMMTSCKSLPGINWLTALQSPPERRAGAFPGPLTIIINIIIIIDFIIIIGRHYNLRGFPRTSLAIVVIITIILICFSILRPLIIIICIVPFFIIIIDIEDMYSLDGNACNRSLVRPPGECVLSFICIIMMRMIMMMTTTTMMAVMIMVKCF